MLATFGASQELVAALTECHLLRPEDLSRKP
jgi:hypothetical protein